MNVMTAMKTARWKRGKAMPAELPVRTNRVARTVYAVAAAALAGIALTLPASAADFTVLNLADSGPGSLRQAVLDANARPGADTIRFADGLGGTIALTTGQLSITGPLTIEGPGADRLAVSGSHQSRVFRITGGVSAALAGVTITSGADQNDGGGILNVGSTLALDKVVLASNRVVGAVAGVPGRGGAVANVAGADLTVTDCVVSQNSAMGSARAAGTGGGILNDASRLTVRGSLFLANEALGGPGGGQGLGGGISSQFEAVADIVGTTMAGNRAIAGSGSGNIGVARGGGIYSVRSGLTMRNCVIEGNFARGGSNIVGSAAFVGTAFGGGIQSAGGAPLTLAGCTITSNQATGGDGNASSGARSFVGSAFGGGLNTASTSTVTDCHFENNEARGGSGNVGSIAGFQFVGTGLGGGINSNAGDTAGSPVNMRGTNLTLRGNRALGGSGNAFGTIANAGIGGGLGSNGSNVNLPVSSGSVTTLQDCTVEHNVAVGGGGGSGMGGGIANILGATVEVNGGIVAHNLAQGGGGGTSLAGGYGQGGGIYNGPDSTHPSNPGAMTLLTGAGVRFEKNASRGGVGVSGGDAAGGGLHNGGDATLDSATFRSNRAIGGNGLDRGAGGNGFGGGVFSQTASSTELTRCVVTRNHANGGEIDGQGVGGGIYTLGLTAVDTWTMVVRNRASTSHDDVYGQIDR